MTPPTFDGLAFEVDDGIATIRLNRPQARNTVNDLLVRELISAFDATDADDSIRAVIITGAGSAFCAGADLTGDRAFDYSLMAARVDEAGRAAPFRDGGGEVTLRIFRSLKPVIAAVNGAAVGVGATIPLAADIRIASRDARFGFVFARRGIVPESASSWFLPRIVGISTALEWCYSGRLVDSEEALQRGLVRSVFAPSDLLPQARLLARQFIDDTAPVSIALTRQLLWRMLAASHPIEAHRLDSLAIQRRGVSDDAREGVASFLEKRAPHFSDRVSDALRDMEQWFADRPPDRR